MYKYIWGKIHSEHDFRDFRDFKHIEIVNDFRPKVKHVDHRSCTLEGFVTGTGLEPLPGAAPVRKNGALFS